MQLFSANATMFKRNKKIFALENMKKPPSMLLIIGPDLIYSVLPIGPTPAKISIPVQ
jgi:hypothetical protein